MNQAYKAAVLAALKAIKSKGNTTEDKGICQLLADNPVIHGRLLEVDRWHFRSWPEFSGSNTYPVPGGHVDAPYAFHRFRKWSKRTAYGQARWRLLDHLIECYEKELGL